MKGKKNGLVKILAAVMVSTLSMGLASCKKPQEETPPEVVTYGEAGIYYFSALKDEYQLSLDGSRYTLTIDGELKTGTYTYDGETLKLFVEVENGDPTVYVASIADNVLTLTYEGGTYNFYKKVTHTVSYNVDGGSEVAPTTVIKGKTLNKPADPVKEGYEFLGWYLDSEYKTPYAFNTQIVTSDFTLYAQWALVDLSIATYTVDFDLGYDGGVAPNAMTTIAGKLYQVPENVTREGYKFCGWWISMYEDGAKLTRKYTPDTVFAANTTLFAVWEPLEMNSKLSAPEVEVFEDAIRWNGTQGVSMYRLKVTGPDGFLKIEEDVSVTNYTMDFASYPAGDYTVELTAIASNQENSSDTVVRSYKNKAVGRVSQFSVIDGGVLLFNRVENADTYYITIDCGNDSHTHTLYNNGDSTYYNFSNCEMQDGGIRFTVTAAADGYASVESETFVYNRMLGKVEGVSVDEETQMLNWYPVKDATNYIVSIKCGDSAHTHMNVNVGTKTSFSLKECPGAEDGKIEISVYAQTKGFNSPAATEYTYNKTQLPAPGNVKMTNVDKRYVLTWDTVAGATGGYVVKIGNSTFETATNSYDLTEEFAWVADTEYAVEVKAKNADGESLWSDPVKVRYYAMVEKLTYKQGVVSWAPVVGATAYEVKVNNGEVQTVREGTSAEIVLTQVGDNTVLVRFIDEDKPYYPETWAKLVIENVQEITFDSRGGSDVPTQYKAMGDPIEYAEPTRKGYEFVGWYNTPRGPESNGALYEDGYFTDNQDITLYAYWEYTTYKVTYQAGKDATDGDVATVGKEYGEAIYKSNYKLDVPKINDPSKVFLGWFAGAGETSEQLTDDRGYSLKPYSLKENMTVYAHFVKDVFKFTLLEDKTYSVSKGYNASKLTTITIPQTYNGALVTVVEAFQQCSNLVTITIPDTVKIIEVDTAFDGCKRLEEVVVTHVEGNNTAVFSSEDGVLLRKNEITGSMELFYYPNAKTGEYVIPDVVTEIPLKVFEGKPITEVTIPQSVTIIRKNAFYACKDLKKITFVEGGTDNLEIEDGAFKNCTSLTSVTLPARLNKLPLNAETHALTLFDGCTALTHVNVEQGNQTYASKDGVITDKAGETLIYCPSARKGSYTVPQGVEKIAEYAFKDCNALTEIIIPGFVEEIGAYAFAGCKKVMNIKFTSGAVAGMETKVGEYAFADLSSLRTVTFEEGSVVSTLGNYAFANSEVLRELLIPASMSYIGDNAFDNAKALASVSFEANGKDLSFGNYVFNECTNLTTVNLPATVVSLNLGVFDGCVNISEIKVDENNTKYKDEDGVVLSKDGKELLFFPKGRKPANGEYDIPTGVEVISDGAFKGMRNVETIVIDNTVTTIGKYAFAESSLTTLTFESGNDEAKLTIDDEAFAGCARITSVALPTRTEIIGKKAFYSVNMQTLTFPANLTTIGDFAFANTGISTVEIPANVTSMGESVFYQCAKLATVTFANGYVGTTISAGMFGETAITSVVIPASIEAIGYGAFNNCSELASVTFQSGGTEALVIGAVSQNSAAANSGVFQNCAKLTAIDIPDRVTYIGNAAFNNCVELAQVNISENSKLQRIGRYAFASCAKLTSIFIPKTVENSAYVDESTSQEYAIGESAFLGTGLTEVVFQDGGTGDLSLGKASFTKTMSLTSITLPNRLSTIWDATEGKEVDGIGRTTFNENNFGSVLETITIADGCEQYSSESGIVYKNKDGVAHTMLYAPIMKTGDVMIPYTVQLLPSRALQESNNVTSVVMEETPAGKTAVPLVIEAQGLSIENLESVTFTERLTEIGSSAFQKTKITSISFPASLEKLGGSAFAIMKGNGGVVVWQSPLESVTFAEGSKLKEISSSTFYGCDKITSIKIPASVETIRTSAFADCTGLTTLDFEDGSVLTKIENNAFKDAKITSLTLPDSLQSLGSAFNGETITELTLPKSLAAIETNTFTNFDGLTAVHIHEDNPKYMSKDGVVYSKDGAELIYYPIKKEIVNGEYITPAGVKTIGANAFNGRGDLTKLTISKDLLYIEEKAFYKSGLTTIIFEERDSQLSIRDYAFQNCWYLSGKDKLAADGETTRKVFEIPSTVVFEGRSAFGSSFLDSVVIEFLGENESTSLTETFSGCTGITAVENVPAILSSMTATFSGCAALETVTFHKDENAMIDTMSGTFKDCIALTRIDLPAVGAMVPALLGTGTFQGCEELQYVTIKSCNVIGKNAFKGCAKLVGVEEVDEDGNPTGNTYFEMPYGVTQIGESAFEGCTSLKAVKMVNSIESIGVKAFYNCSGLTDIAIPDFVATIGNSAFEGCANLVTLKLSANLTNIGDRAFYNCKNLKGRYYSESDKYVFELPNSLESIGAYAFYGLKGLTEITVPASVETVGTYAFAQCSNVTSVTLEEGVQKLDDYAFSGCSKVTSLAIPSSLANIGTGVFEAWDSLKDVTMADGAGYAYKNGIVYNATYTKIVFVLSAKGVLEIEKTVIELAESVFANMAITEIVLPESIRVIPARAFMNCTELVSVKMPANLEKIGEQAFYGCTSLKTIDIPKSVYSEFNTVEVSEKGKMVMGLGVTKDVDGIGAYAFANCTSLENVVFEAGGIKRLSFGDFAFYGCTSLKGTLNDTTGEYEFVIPNRVRGDGIPNTTWGLVQTTSPGSGSGKYDFTQGVGMYAFARCTALQNVVFEEDKNSNMQERLVVLIGAFQECTKLESVKFNSALGDVSRIYNTNDKAGSIECLLFAIQARAFKDCRNLTEVDFAGVDYKKFSVVTSSFEGCDNYKLPKETVIKEYSAATNEIDMGGFNYAQNADKYFLIDAVDASDGNPSKGNTGTFSYDGVLYPGFRGSNPNS